LTKILAIANQKGGVGKTTTTVNLAACLSDLEQRVLLVDLDPQGNATMGSGLEKNDLPNSVYEVLAQGASAKKCIQRSGVAGFDLLPANGDLTAAEVELLNSDRREQRLHEALAEVTGNYDFILIDCPPSLNMLTLNALVAANGIIITMQCEYYALEGLSALLNTVGKVASSINPNLRVEGILRTMYDPRNSLTRDVSSQLLTHFGDKVYRTVIPRNVRLAEAPSHGLPIVRYDRSSRGSAAYQALAQEIMNKLDKTAN
jgi:chromosome partitioning protein|tara:strand:+ start:26131 stop:26907 length:777 start_codon:yes stop_codon:yes gene_type:complete